MSAQINVFGLKVRANPQVTGCCREDRQVELQWASFCHRKFVGVLSHVGVPSIKCANAVSNASLHGCMGACPLRLILGILIIVDSHIDML